MKKVAIITPALLTGGAETMAVRLALGIDKQKYNVKVFCLSNKLNTQLEKLLFDNNIQVIFLGKTKSVSFKTMFKTYKLLSKYNPDIVHSHIGGTAYATPWIIMHKCKLIHTVHTKPDVEFSYKFSFVLRILAKIKKIVIVAVSKENQKIAINFYKLDENYVYYVNNPVDVSKYYKTDKKSQDIVFINVSRQDENKNQILIIKALKQVSDIIDNCKLILVGDGNQHQKLVDTANELEVSDKVIFTGEVVDVENWLAKGDVYVSSSHREGLPLSMLEAMASKLPIISTNVGGISDIINGNGILIGDDDQNAMRDAMIKYAKDESLREKSGKISYQIVQNFDVKKCVEKYEYLYGKFSKK